MKRKIGSVAVAMTVLVIAGVMLLNVLAGLLTDRLFLKADLTSNSMFELSGETVSMLQALDRDATVYYLCNEVDARAVQTSNMIVEFIERYIAGSGGHIKLEFIDPELNPNLKNDFGLAAVSRYDIIIRNEQNKRVNHITYADVYVLDSSGNISGYQIEQKLTGAILNVVAEVVPVVVFLEGHDEQNDYVVKFMDMFTSSGYEVQTVDLNYDELPDNTTLVVIAAPTMDISTEELDKLDTFLADGGGALQKGGNILYLTLTESHRNIGLWMADWGMELADYRVLDTIYRMGSNDYVIPQYLTDHEIFSHLTSGNAVLPLPRSIDVLFTVRSGYTVTPLLNSSNNSFARAFDSANNTLDKSGDDPAGPFTLGAVSSHETYISNVYYQSQVMVMPFMMTYDGFVDSTSILNNQICAGIVRYFNPSGQTVVIEPKGLTDTSLNMTLLQGIPVMVVLVIVIPIGLFILGLVLWLKRRHL